ncbi:MAG: lipoyl synthase, partial [Verrucomicrobia bacterium 21-51-4]
WVLDYSKKRGFVTKSSLMLGLGEQEDELKQALQDLRKVDCNILTLGQYLQPSPKHAPIERWVTPEEFAFWKQYGLSIGFGVVESGPLVRSSYHAEEQSAHYGLGEGAHPESVISA